MPGKPVRLQATTGGVTYPLYTGITDTWATQWTGEFYGTVALSCVDLFGYLQNMYINNPGYYTTLVSGDGGTHLYRLADPPTGSTIKDEIGATSGSAYNARAGAAGPLVTDMLPAVNMSPDGATPTGIATAATLPTGTDWAAEIWANHTQTPAARSYLWSNGYRDTDGVPPGVAVWVDTAGRPGFTEPGGTDHTAATAIADGNWRHLVLNYTNATATYTLYVNGVSVATNLGGGFAFPSGVTLIGMPTWATPACYGQLADFAVYGNTLTPTQIANHYAAAVFPAESVRRPRQPASARSWPSRPAPSTPATAPSSRSPPKATRSSPTSRRSNSPNKASCTSPSTAASTSAPGAPSTGPSPPPKPSPTPPAASPSSSSPQIATDTQDVYEQIQLQRDNGVTQTAGVINGPFGARTYQQSGLVNNTDAEVQGMAVWLAAQFALPVPRIRQIVVRPVSTAATGAAMLALLGLEIGAVVTVTRTAVRRTAFSYVCNVEGINIHVLPDTGDWNAELQLTPLAPYRAVDPRRQPPRLQHLPLLLGSRLALVDDPDRLRHPPQRHQHRMEHPARRQRRRRLPLRRHRLDQRAHLHEQLGVGRVAGRRLHPPRPGRLPPRCRVRRDRRHHRLHPARRLPAVRGGELLRRHQQRRHRQPHRNRLDRRGRAAQHRRRPALLHQLPGGLIMPLDGDDIYLALIAKADNALAANIAFLANASPTNADIVAQVRLLTRECQALIRMALGQLDTTDGT